MLSPQSVGTSPLRNLYKFGDRSTFVFTFLVEQSLADDHGHDGLNSRCHEQPTQKADVIFETHPNTIFLR